MCYAAVSGQDSVSSGGFVGRMLTVAIVALLLLILASCGPTIKQCTIKIDNKSGTINMGCKDTKVPVTATIPVSPVQ